MPWIVKRLPQIPTDWLAFAAGAMIGVLFGMGVGWMLADWRGAAADRTFESTTNEPTGTK